ncbi:MAG: four helix bundle protein [Longimicrobiales bacterium]
MVLNTAEGSGEFSPAEKRRFYRMARRSATEGAAIVEALLTLGLLDFETANELDKALDEITAMLTRLTMHTRVSR